MNISKNILLSMLITSILLLTACSDEKQIQTLKELPPVKVNTITVKKEPVAIWKEYTGTTKAVSDQDVRARVSGILEEIYFKDGANVIKGQKLFKIEQTEYRAQLEEAKANREKNRASLIRAIADVKRYEPLVKEGLAPRATLEQYEAERARFKAAVSANDAKIKRAELNLSYTIVRAPIDGRVSARKVDIGNLVGEDESTVLTTIMSIDPIYAYFSISQKDLTILQEYSKSQKPYAFIELKGRRDTLRLDGFVDFTNNEVDISTSTVTLRTTIDNKEGKVMPGAFVYVNIFINDEYSFTMIPPEVIFADQLGKYVYILGDDSKAKRVDIKTDYETKYYINVKDGLKDGDKVIVSALAKLQKDLKVEATDMTETLGVQAIIKKNNLIPAMRK